MSGGVSTTGGNALLDAYFGSGTPATLYLGIFSGSYTGSPPTEPSAANGYARVAITNDATNFPAASAKIQYLATEQEFPYATSNWITVQSWGLWTASTGGDPVVWGTLNTAQQIKANETLVIPANNLTIRM